MLDAITTQVIGSLVLGLSEEMGVTLMKTAYSPNIKERADRSTAIFNPAGEVIAQAQMIPGHMGSMLVCVEELMKRHPAHTLRPGDMYIANDPYEGTGNHLPDVNLVAPVFYRGELVAYVSAMGHHSDVGGMVPGSESGACRNVFQEGLRLPPVLFVRDGEVNQDILDIILLNTRTPRDRRGDLRAQIAAINVGIRGMVAICDRHGPEVIAAAMKDLLDYCERRVRTGIAAIPDGTYEATDYLDSDGFAERPVRIHLSLTVAGDRLRLDFTGTGPQVESSRNVPRGSLRAVTYAVVKSMIDPGLPANSGYYRALEIHAPPGCLVNPLPPAAVGVRALSHAVVGDVIWQALSRAVPERALAGCGPHHQIIPSGMDPRKGEFFVDYETFAGAYGARPYKDGIDAVRIHASGASNLPVEALEINFPLRVERYELIQDSGGPGRFRGGLSIRRDYRALADGISTALAGERQKNPARGIQGGRPGKPGRFLLNPGTSEERLLPATGWDIPLKTGDLLRIETPGGGGCGDPRERDRERVLRDLQEGRVSAEAARSYYGLGE